MLWAVDYFKEEQADERRSSGWTMAARPPAPTSMPSAKQARSTLAAALDNWDVEAADAAVLNYASVAEPREVFELLWQYGARDFRGIGHKAITVQNAHRILSLLGWEYRDPEPRVVAALTLAGSLSRRRFRLLQRPVEPYERHDAGSAGATGRLGPDLETSMSLSGQVRNVTASEGE